MFRNVVVVLEGKEDDLQYLWYVAEKYSRNLKTNAP